MAGWGRERYGRSGGLRKWGEAETTTKWAGNTDEKNVIYLGIDHGKIGFRRLWGELFKIKNARKI